MRRNIYKYSMYRYALFSFQPFSQNKRIWDTTMLVVGTTLGILKQIYISKWFTITYASNISYNTKENLHKQTVSILLIAVWTIEDLLVRVYTIYVNLRCDVSTVSN